MAPAGRFDPPGEHAPLRSRPAVLLLLLFLLAPAARAADPERQLVEDLKRALKRGEAGERVAVLERMTRAASQLEAARRRSAAVYIAKALPEEPTAEVRAAMIRTLSHLGGSTGWVPILLAWRAGGADDVVRHAARQALLWGGGDYLDVVKRLLSEDDDPTFRADLLLLLGDRRKADVVPLLLDALEKDHDLGVRSAAAEALEAVTREAKGYDVAAWRAWWDARPEAAPPEVEGGGETTTGTAPDPGEIPEPPPVVTRSLVPSFYGMPIHAKDVVFVVDVSGSVGNGGVNRAKKEVIDAVELLGSDVHVAALFFDEDVRMWKPEMVLATPANKAALALFLRGIGPGRRTDIMTPLNAGVEIVERRVKALERAGAPIREAVAMIVVSDGVQTASRTPPAAVEEKLARLDPAHTVIHCIALGGKGSALLFDLARLGGGRYIEVR